MIFVERVIALTITLPILGLLGDSFGVWSEHGIEDGLIRLLEEPFLLDSFLLSLVVALASVFLSLHLASGCVSRLFFVSRTNLLQILILAMPHTALALGIVLLLSSDGVLSRWILIIFGLPTADYLFPRDPLGLGTLMSLVIKETIFITAVGLAFAKKLPIDAMLLVGHQAGFSRKIIWRKLLWPQIRRKLQPILLIVFLFGLTNLEVAAILGPDQPQFFAVRLHRMLQDPDDLTRQAGALGSLVLLSTAILLAWIMSKMYRPKLVTDRPVNHEIHLNLPVEHFFLGIVIASIAGLLIWANLLRWPSNQFFPIWSIQLSQSADLFAQPLLQTCLIGASSSIFSILIAVWVLECRLQKNIKYIHIVWWCCLWIPTLSFSSGLLAWMFVFGVPPSIFPVLLAHTLIGTPFALMMLSESWYARDQRMEIFVKQSGRSKLWAVTFLWIPKMSDTFLLTFAVCFSVSCSLYTQTVILGGGRVTTLMTELVSYGIGDRRLASLAALLNTFLPLLCFAFTASLSRLLWRHRLGMQGAGVAIVR